MKNGFDIHDFKLRAEYAVRRLKDSDVSERNKKLILSFRDFCVLEGISVGRIERYLCVLRLLAELLKKDYDKATKNDIIKLVTTIQTNENLAAWTKSTYKKMLKRFYKWLKKTGDEYPEQVKWMKTSPKRNEIKLPGNGDMITEKEIEKLIDVAEHPRDKAFISVLYESGGRVGEVGSLQLKNVKVDEYGAVINVEGKTGCRPIRIVSSTPHLITWMNTHPLKNNPEAPLWINFGTTNHNQPLKYANLRIMLKKLFEKAEIKKRFNPHMFRHSRATFLANHLTEFQMNHYFGWVQGGRMASTYVHLSGQNIDSSILELNGLKNRTVNNDSCLKPVICQRCDTINAHGAKFCNKCAGILDIKTAYQLESKMVEEKARRKGCDEIMDKMMNDEKFKQMFAERAREMGFLPKV